jgi:hypothetical protein
VSYNATSSRVRFEYKYIFTKENAQACYNADVEAVNLQVVGLASVSAVIYAQIKINKCTPVALFCF